MSSENKKNVLYFEAPTMRELYETLEIWQHQHEKRFLSTSIQLDCGMYCCIALSNPAEVVIMDRTGSNHAKVSNKGYLQVDAH